jgi:SPP1 gp7 family putative phage head morphogenesis protein
MDDFPYQLEEQYAKLFKSIFRKNTKPILSEINKILNTKVETDADDKRPNQTQEFKINSVLSSFGLLFISDSEKKKLANFFKILSSYSFARAKSAVDNLKAQRTKSKKFFPQIIMDKNSRTIQDFQNSYVAFNQELVRQLGKEWIEGVSRVVKNGFVDGIGVKAIKNQLLELDQVQASKANFWARDQFGDAYSSFTETRFKEAGINSYIWMTSQDNRVRDSHANLHGKYFKTTDTPPGLSKPNAKLPGEDYNCRCRMMPAIDETDQLPEEERQKVINRINQQRKNFEQPEVIQ